MQRISGYTQTAAGAFLFLLAFSVMVPLTRATLWAGTPIASSFVLAYVVGGAGIWFAISISFRGLVHTRPTAQALLATDPRPPVLILRPAADGGGMVSARVIDPVTQPAETAVHTFLNGIGPVIAPTRPGEPPHAPAAAALRVKAADWRSQMAHWMGKARFTILLSDEEEPVASWELCHLLDHVSPTHFLLYFPLRSGDPAPREAHYAAYREALAPMFPKGLPYYLGDSIFVRFDADWRPQPTRLVELDRWVDPSYKPLPLWKTPERTRTMLLASLLMGVAAELAFGFLSTNG